MIGSLLSIFEASTLESMDQILYILLLSMINSL